MVGAVFRPEAELTLFLRMRTKEIDKTGKIYSDRRVIPLLQEIGVAEANLRGHIFERKLVNRRFCACTVKNRPKTRSLYCQIAKILAPLWKIALAEHDGI